MKMTTEELKKLEEEGRELSKELRRRIRKMWDIPYEQLKTPCNGCISRKILVSGSGLENRRW